MRAPRLVAVLKNVLRGAAMTNYFARRTGMAPSLQRLKEDEREGHRGSGDQCEQCECARVMLRLVCLICPACLSDACAMVTNLCRRWPLLVCRQQLPSRKPLTLYVASPFLPFCLQLIAVSSHCWVFLRGQDGLVKNLQGVSQRHVDKLFKK